MSEATTNRQRITTDSTTQTAKQLADQLLNVSATNLNALGNLHLPDVRFAGNIWRQYMHFSPDSYRTACITMQQQPMIFAINPQPRSLIQFF